MRLIEYIVDEADDSRTVRDFLKHRGYSSGVITLLKKSPDGIKLNSVRAFTNAVIHEGDCLTVTIDDEPSAITPEPLNYKIAYEDDDILVYDKPAGVVVHPTKIYQSGTLGNDYANLCKNRGITCTFRPVYRIDRNTSGLVLIAKNKLSSCVNIDKRYICICHGVVAERGVFDKPISLCPDSKIKREINYNGQTAITHYKRIAVSDNYSLCEVTLETGRTHQIRVHFSSAGHPLAGDSLYGYSGDGINRHALHCAHVGFVNPITNKSVELSSILPDDMRDFVKNNNIL